MPLGTTNFPRGVKRKSSIAYPSVIILTQLVLSLSMYQSKTCAERSEASKSEIVNDETLLLSRNHPQTTRLLGIARMPDHPALLHPGGRRDDEPCHLPARARTRAVERGVRRAVCPSR